jgi:hypothetical protein
MAASLHHSWKFSLNLGSKTLTLDKAEHGALGVHAVEVVWECVVGWATAELDVDVEPDVSGVELGSKEDALPLKQLLPQIVAALSIQSESPDSSASAHILAILHRLAHQTNEIATEIVSTPNLITSLTNGHRTLTLSTTPWTQAQSLLTVCHLPYCGQTMNEHPDYATGGPTPFFVLQASSRKFRQVGALSRLTQSNCKPQEAENKLAALNSIPAWHRVPSSCGGNPAILGKCGFTRGNLREHPLLN